MLRTAATLSTAPTSTWAGLPTASTATGRVFRVTDYGVAGVGLLVISDGTRWVPTMPQLLARSGVAASVTGTTSETALATCTVPPNGMGTNGGVMVYSTWSGTNSSNAKSPRLRFGGIGGTAYMAGSLTTSPQLHDMRRIRNRNATGSQVGLYGGTPSYAVTNGAIITSSVDTTAAVDLVLSGQLALGSETQTLENYEVWITP